MDTLSRAVDPRTAAIYAALAECPDCVASIAVSEDQGGRPVVDIGHTPQCPALAALTRQGRDHMSMVVLVSDDDEPLNRFANAVQQTTAELGPPRPMYRDLYGDTE